MEGARSYLHSKPTITPIIPAITAMIPSVTIAIGEIVEAPCSIFIAATKASNRTLIANALGNAP